MTTTTRNEAAERLRAALALLPTSGNLQGRYAVADFDEALAAAKAEGAREAVERIRTRAMLVTTRGQIPIGKYPRIYYLDTVLRRDVYAILDEEAAR